MSSHFQVNASSGKIAFSLFLLTLMVYAVTLPGSFFPDDVVIIKQNRLVEHLDFLAIFTTDYWGAGENSGLYRPLPILSFALNRQILGPSPLGHLLVNLLLHTLVTWLLYIFLIRINVPVRAAWAAAAIFAVHPIHGEAVAELVGRSELLAATFGLMTLLLARSSHRFAAQGAVLSFLAALLSKESAVTLLVLVPIVDIFFARGGATGLKKHRVLWLGLLVAAALWYLWRKIEVHPLSRPQILDPYAIPLSVVDHATRILVALKLQGRYLVNLLYPFDLLGLYPVSMVKRDALWFSPGGVAVVAAVLLVAAALFVGWQRHSIFALFLALYLVSFIPASQLFFPTEFVMADRVAYFPSLWFCSALAVLVMSIPAHRYALAAFSVVLFFFLVAGVARAFDFRTPESLWLSDLRKSPENEASMLMLGDYCRAQGRKAEAEKILQRLIQVAPDFEQGLSVYAGVLVEQEKPREAIAAAKRAIRLMQNGNSLAKMPLAAAYNQLGHPDEALAVLASMPDVTRNQSVYWFVRGRSLELKRDWFGALSAYRRELEIDSGAMPEIYLRLSRVHLQLGDARMAESALQQELLHNPQSAAAWNLLGVTLVQQKKIRSGRDAFKKAVDLMPESVEYRTNLAKAEGEEDGRKWR